MSDFDTNRDQLIDRDEFVVVLCAHDSHESGVPTNECDFDRYATIFHAADTDKNGGLDIEEVAILREVVGRSPENAAYDLLEAIFTLQEFANTEEQLMRAVSLVQEACKRGGGVTLESFLSAIANQPVRTEFDSRIGGWLRTVFDAADMDEDRVLDDSETWFLSMGITKWWEEGMWQQVLPDRAEAVATARTSFAEDGAGQLDDTHSELDEVDDDDVESAMEEFDTNGDKHVDMQEFMAVAKKTNPEQSALARATVLFMRADMDQNGLLTKEEMAGLLTTVA